jgi:hypothetical protein
VSLLGGYLSDRLRRPLGVIGGSLVIVGICTILLVHVHTLVALTAVVAAVNAVFVQF